MIFILQRKAGVEKTGLIIVEETTVESDWSSRSNRQPGLSAYADQMLASDEIQTPGTITEPLPLSRLSERGIAPPEVTSVWSAGINRHGDGDESSLHRKE